MNQEDMRILIELIIENSESILRNAQSYSAIANEIIIKNVYSHFQSQANKELTAIMHSQRQELRKLKEKEKEE